MTTDKIAIISQEDILNIGISPSECIRWVEEGFRIKDEIRQVLLGRNPGRTSEDERILSYNYGLGLHDIVFASKIYDMMKGKDIRSFDYNRQDLKLWV